LGMGMGDSIALSPISSSMFLMSIERSATLRAAEKVSFAALHERGGALTDGDRNVVIADEGDGLVVGRRHVE